MAEHIERAAAVKAVLRMRRPENSVAQNRMLSIIQMDMLKLPAADVAPVVYVHPKGRYIVAECKGVRETFFPEDVIQCDLPGPPPMDYDLEYALVTLTEVDKKIMAALGRKF